MSFDDLMRLGALALAAGVIYTCRDMSVTGAPVWATIVMVVPWLVVLGLAALAVMGAA